MVYNPLEPYNDLPLLPPQQELETRPVLRKCIAANKSLAELKGAGDLIPNQSMLINAIPLKEAQLSSEIENIVTTQDKLFRAAIDESGNVDPATKEVLRYRTAVHHGFDVLKNQKLTLSVIQDLCSIIRNQPVSFRTEERVAIGNPVTRAVIYTPPIGASLIGEKLENLENYLLSRDALDPLIKMAVIHYQLEAIHPFTDGNGRTGRILNVLYMIEENLIRIPVLYHSRHIIKNKQEYYDRLRAVTEEKDWENWLLYMLTAVEETAKWTTSRILAIRDLFEQTCESCRVELPRKVYSKELIEIIFIQPYCKIKFLVDAGIAKRQTAAEYLRALENIGILVSEKRGRQIIYKHPALLEVLSA